MVGLTSYANKMNELPADQLMAYSLVLRSVANHSFQMKNAELKADLITDIMLFLTSARSDVLQQECWSSGKATHSSDYEVFPSEPRHAHIVSDYFLRKFFNLWHC